MKKITFNMINYQATYVLILTNSNHTTFRPLHSRETVPFKPFIGSALCSCTHHDDRLQFCCVAMNAASSHGVILPLAHTHTNTLSHAVVWSAVAAHVRPAPRPDCDWRSSQSLSSGDGRLTTLPPAWPSRARAFGDKKGAKQFAPSGGDCPELS